MTAVKASSVMPLLQLAAKHGCWMVQRSYMTKLCELVGVEMELGASMFDVCFSLVATCCPKLCEDDMMDALKHRKVMMSRSDG